MQSISATVSPPFADAATDTSTLSVDIKLGVYVAKFKPQSISLNPQVLFSVTIGQISSVAIFIDDDPFTTTCNTLSTTSSTFARRNILISKPVTTPVLGNVGSKLKS